jgi:hypothetical protein
MRLGRAGDARIALVIAGYQFPALPGGGSEPDWDANWLFIAGDAQTKDGRSWSFHDPCLTTWEARELDEWLGVVADGSVEVASGPFDEDDPVGVLVFAEPNLAFSLAELTSDTATIRVHLSNESAPPWVTGQDRFAFFDFFLPVTTSLRDLASARNHWKQMLTAHPVR